MLMYIYELLNEISKMLFLVGFGLIISNLLIYF